MIMVKRFEHLAVVPVLSFCVQRLLQPVNLLLQFSSSGMYCHDNVPLQDAALEVRLTATSYNTWIVGCQTHIASV